MEFIGLINEAIDILKKEKEQNKNLMFEGRFLKMIEYLEELKIAYQANTMNKSSICLNIVRMLDHGDSEILQEAITRVNHYYQENIYQEKF